MPPRVQKVQSTTNQTTRTPISRSRVVDEDSAWPEEHQGIKMVCYGPPGSGKTTLWSSFPGPILALIVSGGSKPGELRSIDTPEMRKKVVPRVVRDSSRFESLLKDAGDYATVVLDHCTGLQDLIVKELLGLDSIPVQRTWGLATRDQWGQIGIKTKELMRLMMDIEQNVFIVAQERDFSQEGKSDPDVPSIGPSLTPSAAGWLNQAADYIVETFTREEVEERQMPSKSGKGGVIRKGTGKKEYCLRIDSPNTFITKFRAVKGRQLPPLILDPDYDKIYALIRGQT